NCGRMPSAVRLSISKSQHQVREHQPPERLVIARAPRLQVKRPGKLPLNSYSYKCKVKCLITTSDWSAIRKDSRQSTAYLRLSLRCRICRAEKRSFFSLRA